MLVAAALPLGHWFPCLCGPSCSVDPDASGVLIRVPQESGVCCVVYCRLLCVRGSLFFLTGQGAVLFNIVSILY